MPSHARKQSQKYNSEADREAQPVAESGLSSDEDDDDDDYDDDDNTDASYVETNVLLGYVEEGKENGDGNGNGRDEDGDAGDGSGSFLGGWPVSDNHFF